MTKRTDVYEIFFPKNMSSVTLGKNIDIVLQRRNMRNVL